MVEERISFTGTLGHTLAGNLRHPVGRPRGYAILAHCFTCGKDLRASHGLSDALAMAGLGVLRFDFTGLGRSGGDFEDTTFVSNVGDLVEAARWLEEAYEAPSLMVGHSLGGTATIAAAARLPSVRAVATIGAPYSPAHASWILDPVRHQLRQHGSATLTLAGREVRVGEELLDDLEQSTIAADLEGLRRPLLVLHAPLDDVVGVDNARELFEAARHPKSFISLDGADHLLTDARDAAWAGSVIAAWAERVLPVGDDEPEGQRGTVDVVTGVGFATEVRAGPHRWVADEPARLGGTDRGPTPYDQLLAALGSCTGMTLRMYADRKEWPLDEVTVRLRHERVHMDDCEGCSDGAPKRIDVLHRDIELVGELTEAQRARLVEMADRCPVHRTLEGPLEIQTTSRR